MSLTLSTDNLQGRYAILKDTFDYQLMLIGIFVLFGFSAKTVMSLCHFIYLPIINIINDERFSISRIRMIGLEIYFYPI